MKSFLWLSFILGGFSAGIGFGYIISGKPTVIPWIVSSIFFGTAGITAFGIFAAMLGSTNGSWRPK